ncbi:AI-2E family transporter [Chitiniphilus eburneus]|uniref:AI-2E family transporter n=1 Tax=Chitiniphilus eburneus TaxID=2571148 RepID=A0A4U0PUC4_9NEIS|nr:AI-2E family transporter [Chitiniphilus eburneus]TJZ66654.1 AI-2E family transporter [Chitiniphilus eburneus]
MNPQSPRWIEPAIAAGSVVLLLALSYQILAPFIAALVWAGILVYATWTPFLWLSRKLGDRRGLAAALLVLLFALLILVPLVVAGVELSLNLDEIVAWARSKLNGGLPDLPAWLLSLPWFGPKLAEFWGELNAGDPETMARLHEWIKPLGGFLLVFGKAVGSGLLLLVLSLFFSFFLYVSGHSFVKWLMAALRRIGGERAQALMKLAGGTVRGVVYGFIGTALVQGALAWFGYWLAGVPNAAAFGLVSCFLSLIPGGPSLLGLPVAAWLYMQGGTGWAIFLAIWMVAVVASADNIVKPLVIGKESNLPFVLILIGVLGGALAWGMLGVFLGPTLLAVSFTLLRNWGATPTLAEAEAAMTPPADTLSEAVAVATGRRHAAPEGRPASAVVIPTEEAPPPGEDLSTDQR